MADETKTIEQAAEQLKTQAKNAAREAAELAVKDVKTEVDAVKSEFKATAEKLAADLKTVADQADKLDVLSQRVGTGFAGDDTKGAFLRELEAKAADIRGRKRGQTVEFDLSTKAAADLLSGAVAPGRIISPTRLPGIITPPNQLTHVRPLIMGGTIGAPSFTYLRESGFTGAPAMTAEGTRKPQVGIELQEVIGTVKKVAAYFKMSTELMADFPSLMSFLSGRVEEKIKLVEDAQLLYGDNTGQNLQGIYPLAQPFSAGTLKVQKAQIIDVIRAAAAQVRRAQYRATDVLMNPDDLAQLELTKDDRGDYLLPTLLTGTLPSIGRVRLVEVDAMLAGEFLAGAFDMGAQVFEREGLTIRFYDQNEDDAVTNKMTCVIEERLVQAVYRPESFVKGTYTAAIAALTTV